MTVILIVHVTGRFEAMNLAVLYLVDTCNRCILVVL